MASMDSKEWSLWIPGVQDSDAAGLEVSHVAGGDRPARETSDGCDLGIEVRNGTAGAAPIGGNLSLG
jgi:hypothetical protein